MSRYAVVSTDTLKPFLLGFTLTWSGRSARKAGSPTHGRSLSWLEGETLPTMRTPPPTPRRCEGGGVDLHGECFDCDAIQGEACRKPKPKSS